MNLLTQLLRRKLGIALTIPLFGISTIVVTPAFTATKYKLVQNLIGSDALAQQVSALSPQEVNLRAKQITVRIDGAAIGTGVIIDESDTTYTVLTNWHVVKQPGKYFIQAIDGRKYTVDYNTVKQLPNLDLAILKFERKQNYQLAEIGNSNSLIEGQNLYFAGYPGELRQEDNRYYRFFSASLVGILPESTANGYSLVYNGEAFPGMSGGPVLDSQGLLIGIHGEANIHALTGGTSNYAIPINYYQTAIAKITSPVTENNNQPNDNNSVTPSVTPSVAPSVTVDTAPPEKTSPPETATAQNRRSVTRESSPNRESVAATPNENNSTENNSTEDNSTENTTTPLNSQSSSNADDNNNNSSTIVSVPTLTKPAANPQQPSRSESMPKSELISRATGIDYKPLKELLVSQKWQQADRQTQTLISRIIDTAKRKNSRSFITTNEIADYACHDIYIINTIWQKYSDKKFGFSPQQRVWQNINQNSDFSLNTWRSFATEIGWKQGEITDSSGYLLYEQLIFDPKTAPSGHLPWWFAASDEQQKIIKTVLNRCSLRRIDNVVNETNPDDSEPKKTDFVR